MSQENFMSYEDAVTIISEIASKLGLKVDSSAIGTNGGIAELDSTGKVPSSQLPSFVDDVLEYDSLSKFPATGEAGKIYVAKDTNKTYRWSGTAYVEISPSLALGETSSTAYRGDRGKTAYTHATDGSRLTTATASGLYKVASTAQGHIAGLTAVTKADITGLGIPGSDTDTTYTFANGTNQFTVTPKGGSAQTVKVTPSFTVATGDANGQVKIDGKNAYVKGLGTAAYTASTAYVASTNGTHTGELKLFREGTTDDNVSTRLIFSNKNTTTGSTSTGYIDAFNGGANGANMVIRPAGNLFLGSGESAANHFNAGFAQSTGEVLYIDSDNQIHLQANAQTIANRVGAQIDNSGNIIPEKADVATNNIGGIGTSSYKWANGYFTNINGVEVGTPKFTDASVNQAETKSSNWRKVVLGVQNNSEQGQAVVAATDKVYVSPSLEFQPSTGTFRASGTIKATKLDAKINVPRVAEDCKTLPGANAITFKEYTAGSNYNLPSNHWYYIFNVQGSDTNYGAQLALGMTVNAAYYRVYNNKTWGNWKSIINTNTTYTASTTSVGSASAGTAIAADDIIAWSAGTVPSLTITNTACDDITAWSAGTMTSASYSKGVLTITNGSAPSLSYTARTVGSASGWSAGTAPSLSYTARSIPNISVSSKTVVTGITAD